MIGKRTLEVENEEKNVSQILDLIANELNENGWELDYLIIDQIKVNENYQNYLLKTIETIQEVIVKVKDLKSMVNETLGSAYDYIEKVIEGIELIADSFYKSPSKETWEQLANLFEGIQWLIDTMVRIDEIKNLKAILINYVIWNEYVLIIKELCEQIVELKDAMLNHDSILIADLLIYEILPIFKNANEKLRFLIPSEGNNHVS